MCIRFPLPYVRRPALPIFSMKRGGRNAGANMLRLLERLKAHPDVETATFAASYTLPYTYANSNNNFFNDSISVTAYVYDVQPDYFRVFDIRPADGKDAGQLAEALKNGYVISRTMEEKLFGTAGAIGKYLTTGREDSTRYHVTGVTAPIKKLNNEQPGAVLFSLLKDAEIYDASEQNLGRTQICFRTRSGVEGSSDYAARFKKEMKQSLSAGNFWLADVQYFPDVRTGFIENSLSLMGRRLSIAINLFLLVNIFLAMIGTFWFRVNRRRSELGLRMAMGSSRQGLRKLVVSEGLLMLTMVAIPALVICLNLAYLDILNTEVMKITFGRLLVVSLLTWGILAAIIWLAVWYPSRQASRMEPAEALHCE